MRIVETDNFGRDYPDESFVLSYMTPAAAKELCEVLNKHLSGRDSDRYWKPVPDNYELQPGFEP